MATTHGVDDDGAEMRGGVGREGEVGRCVGALGYREVAKEGEPERADVGEAVEKGACLKGKEWSVLRCCAWKHLRRTYAFYP